MKMFPRSSWRYAILIIILFAIVATAARFIIIYLGEQLPQPEYEQVIWELSVAVWALTMGCLFLAGALGLWAIRATVETEGRRRIERFVDTMDYLSDGLVVLDRVGRITGSNPAARKIAPRVVPADVFVSLQDVFPCLTDLDMECLLDFRQLREIERDCAYTRGLHTLRFRSQPSEGVMLVLISDVTDMRSQEIRQRQIAQLQLVGRIAAGMAHDFNNILCSISGHAELLSRSEQNPESVKRSVNIILDETEKGSQLSRQLLGLSRAGGPGTPTERLHQDVEDAAALLRVALSTAWTVKTLIEGQFPAVPLTSAQIEQVVLNLGLLIVDFQPKPGTIMITLDKPGQGHLMNVGDQFAAVIIISGAGTLNGNDVIKIADMEKAPTEGDEAGVILSVVKSMVDQAHGRMDQFMAPTGLCVYRICLPHLDVRENAYADDSQITDAFDHYVSHWQILLGGTGNEINVLKRHLKRVGTVIMEKETIVSLLAYVESYQTLDVIVVDKRILGIEADGLLRAMLKLCPRMGIVVLCQDPQQEPAGLNSAMVFIPYGVGPERIIRAMVEAKGRVRSV